MADLQALRWNGHPGHYEVYYVTLTDPVSGLGLWIRFTLLAPEGPARAPTCSLWFVATRAEGPAIARKATFPAERLSARGEPFSLRIGDAELSDRGTRGELDGAAWDLRWEPGRSAEHVGPFLRRAGVAQTVLVLPNADVRVAGSIVVPGLGSVEIDGVHGAQAHLWGTRHSERWTWAHCGDFAGAMDGRPRPGTFLDGVSVYARRAGREVGPASPVVGRFLDDDFAATALITAMRAESRFGLTSWSLRARDGARRIEAEVFAPRASLAGVTYEDPDGRRAYCYNSEVASMRVSVLDRTPRRPSRWTLREVLTSAGRAHFEYGQRDPVAGLELHLP